MIPADKIFFTNSYDCYIFEKPKLIKLWNVKKKKI